MQLDKTIESEVIQVYDAWLNSYLNGDVETYNSFLDDGYRFIGSTDNEEFLNNKETTNFLRSTADQLAGKTQVRNSQKTIQQVDGIIFVTHLFDGYFLNGEDWSYYGRFRFTSALHKTKKGWQFIYQHCSTPDAKAEEGETLDIEQITKENRELREAIKRRTAELENNNRELEIEAALERDRLEIALNELQATQDQLVQQEKLASLGQLTAGIAHEIKNPLNFVNNFSEVSMEIIGEAKEEIREINSKFNIQNSELSHLLDDVEANHEHGSRADSIVKSMLEHSRGGSGKMELTNLNDLVKEFANLSFHGMRASKDPINVDMEFDLDESIGKVPLIAEDFSRVIINLCNNGFDAMREKLTADGGRRTDDRGEASEF